MMSTYVNLTKALPPQIRIENVEHNGYHGRRGRIVPAEVLL
jgi:hypothetical protein